MKILPSIDVMENNYGDRQKLVEEQCVAIKIANDNKCEKDIANGIKVLNELQKIDEAKRSHLCELID